jgi:diacylglycerol kinase (ATP)
VVTGADVGGMDDHRVRAAVDVLRAKADVQLCTFSLPSELDSALHRRGTRSVVIVGGDASLHIVVSALHRRMELDNTVLGMLPVGRNDFAQAAGIPSSDLEEAAQVVLAGAERRFDLIQDCRGDVLVNSVHVGARTVRLPGQEWLGQLVAGVSSGVGAGAGAATGGRGRHGLGDLADHALHGLWAPETSADDRRPANRRSKPLRVLIEADGQIVADFDQPVLWVDVNNTPSSVGRPARAPGADPCDGQLDLVVRYAVGRLTRFARTLRRHHLARLDGPDTVRVRASKVRVAGQRFWLNADGKSGGYEQRCTWTVAPHRLRMIVPA